MYNFFIFPVLVYDREDAMYELGVDGVYDGYLVLASSQLLSARPKQGQQTKRKMQPSKRPVIIDRAFLVLYVWLKVGEQDNQCRQGPSGSSGKWILSKIMSLKAHCPLFKECFNKKTKDGKQRFS